MSEEIKYEYKEVGVPVAFTDEGRKENLEKLQQKMAQDGWELVEYTNGGMAKASTAKFKRDLNYVSNTPKKNNKIKIILAVIVFIIILISLTDNEVKENDSKDTSYYKKHEDKTLYEARNLGKGELEKISLSYAKENGIDEDYYGTMYDCLGYNIYSKNEDFKISKVIEWCKDDYVNKEKQAVYINKNMLLEDFSSWDGSYTPLVNIIKKSMNDSSSYKHIDTRYSFVSSTDKNKRAYMQVIVTFSGKNVFGGIVKQEAVAKVDAKTKEIYDIQF